MKGGSCMKFSVYTLGCKVNAYESEYVIEQMQKNGYIKADFNDICDIYIINTCTVTNTSDIKSRKIIRQAKRRNPNACVVAMGCFIEANPNYKDEAIDLYIGTVGKGNIVELLDDYFKKKEVRKEIPALESTSFDKMQLNSFLGHARAFVKIEDGCENFCSYCIIPFVRGKCRSKKLEDVINEVKTLVANGYQEIVLTGINTGRYGLDIGTSLAILLQELTKIEGLKRLRISSIEVTELTDEFMKVLKESSIIVDHLHIPLQAGSDHILTLMERRYNLEEYKNVIKKIRMIRPNISITTDIIVGFPGETEEDFQDTLKTARELAFAKLHVFPYSARKNTKAVDFTNQIDQCTKKERVTSLLKLDRALQEEYAKKFIGQEVEVLIEEYKNGYSIGHTSNYLKVKIKQELEPNTFISVHLVDYANGVCTGKVKELVECHS